MILDIAMGGSTNTVLHLLAVANEAGTDFHMSDIDMLSRRVPCICKVAPNTAKYHVQDVGRAGGIVAIMAELAKAGLVDTSLRRVDGLTLEEEIDRWCILSPNCTDEARKTFRVAPCGRFNIELGSQKMYYDEFDTDRENGCIRDVAHAYTRDGGLAVLFGNIARDGCIVKTAGVDESIFHFEGPARVFDSQEAVGHGAAGITGRGHEYVDGPAVPRTARKPPQQARHEAGADVLEGEGGAVEELQGTDTARDGHDGTVETKGLFNDPVEFLGGHVLSEEGVGHGAGDLLEGERLDVGVELGGEYGDPFGHVEPAVLREAPDHGLLKAGAGSFAVGAVVLHGSMR